VAPSRQQKLLQKKGTADHKDPERIEKEGEPGMGGWDKVNIMWLSKINMIYSGVYLALRG